MVAFLSSCSILSYLIGPICLISFRHYRPYENKGFRLKWANLVCFLGFYAGMLMLLWCGFEIIWKLAAAISLGVVIHFFAEKKMQGLESWLLWFFAFFILLLPISYVSTFGGIGLLKFPFDLLMMLPVSYFLLKLSVRFAEPSKILVTDGTFDKNVAPVVL